MDSEHPSAPPAGAEGEGAAWIDPPRPLTMNEVKALAQARIDDLARELAAAKERAEKAEHSRDEWRRRAEGRNEVANRLEDAARNVYGRLTALLEWGAAPYDELRQLHDRLRGALDGEG